MDLLSKFMKPSFLDKFAEISGRGGEVVDQVTLLVDQCNSVFPHKHWKLIAALPWSDEPILLGDWVTAELSNVPRVQRTMAVYFGLHNPCVGGRPSIGIEMGLLAGPLLGNDLWAAFSQEDADVFFTPGDFRSSLLNAVYDIAYGTQDGIGNNIEYTIGLGYCFFVIPAMIRRVRFSSFRSVFARSIGICAGFHDGDGVDIGAVNIATEIEYDLRNYLKTVYRCWRRYHNNPQAN